MIQLDQLDANSLKSWFDGIDTFLLDCDGVLWHGHDLLPGIADTIDFLLKQGKRLLLVTNNSTQSRAAYAAKTRKLGLKNITEEHIFSSAYATAYYLKECTNVKSIYVIGEQGVRDELALQELNVVENSADNAPITSKDELKHIQDDTSIDCVVFGFDVQLNYRKLAKAFTYLHQRPDCYFIATNADTTYPMDENRLFPGTGSLLATLVTSLDRQPLVMGKPHAPLMQCIQKKYNLDRKRTCMVGDRLDTDMAFGKANGCQTLLVLTGVTRTREEALSSPHCPDSILQSFGDFIQLL